MCLDARFTYKANSGELVSEIQCEWCLSLQWGDTTTTGQMDQETEFLGNRDLVRILLFLAALEGYCRQFKIIVNSPPCPALTEPP